MTDCNYDCEECGWKVETTMRLVSPIGETGESVTYMSGPMKRQAADASMMANINLLSGAWEQAIVDACGEGPTGMASAVSNYGS